MKRVGPKGRGEFQQITWDEALDTVDYADIALPASTFLEHGDFYKSYGHLYLQKADPVIAPVGEAKSNLEVFQLLAARMGFHEAMFQERLEDQIHGALESEAVELRGGGYVELRDGRPHRLNVPAQTFRNGFPTYVSPLVKAIRR